MMQIMLAFVFASDYYKLGCVKASRFRSTELCMEWKQYRRTAQVSNRGKFQMGCRSQLLSEDNNYIIEKCDKLTKKEIIK